MQYEVEQKYPVHDIAQLEADLQQLGVELDEGIVQVDRYFAHPQKHCVCLQVPVLSMV